MRRPPAVLRPVGSAQMRWYGSPLRTRVLDSEAAGHANRMRLFIFLMVFVVVAGLGLAYDFTRPAVYRGAARISVEPPGVEDAAAKAQFALSEAAALQKPEIIAGIGRRLDSAAPEPAVESIGPKLTAEAVPQTSVIDLRAEGHDRAQILAVLGAWIEAYQASRRQSDRAGESEAAAESRHAVAVAEKAISTKRQEIEAFRARHGIASMEREENPGAARLKGLYVALNDAAAKEVAAEAKLKAVDDSVASGKGYVRAADRASIANLEMRALDLREKMKDLEHDFTAQYLTLDPKYKALRANLQRVEQQIETEKQRSLSTARTEAQEEYAGMQRATLRIREQVEALQKDSQSFSVRFLELKRMATDLEQLQETRREVVAKLQRVELARQPAAVRIQVLSAPAVDPDPVSPAYLRDAGIALGAALLLAIGGVWLGDYLTRVPQTNDAPVQPIIQIAYPALSGGSAEQGAPAIAAAAASPLLAAPSAGRVIELSAGEVGALWTNADGTGRLVLALIFSGVSTTELNAIRRKDIDLVNGVVDVGGASARRLTAIDPLRSELAALENAATPEENERLLLADATGRGLSEAEIDIQLACLAHDAGLRQPETVTAQALHFTYAAFLARQGMRMSELHTIVGRLSGDRASALLRLSPPGGLVDAASVERVYPSFRLA